MYRSGNKVGWGRPTHDHGPDPAEYYARVDAAGPEKRLRLAVLLNAMADLQRGATSPAGDEAARWVRGEIDATDASFSFRAICEALDLDDERLMRALLAPDGPRARLPRRQVRTESVRPTARRYRARACAEGES
jgi:hypothetical protein